MHTRRRRTRHLDGRRQRTVLLCLLAAVLSILAACADTDAPSPAPEPGTGAPFQLGLVGSEDPGAIRSVARLGARVMRAEFTVDTTAAELEPVVAAAAQNEVRLQPLVGWDNGSPAPDLTPLAEWATAFGPGGTFWDGRSDEFAITDIELGNENSFTYKSGDVRKSRYRDLAVAYGQRALAAARAVHAANPRVGVLVELESGDTEQGTWIDAVLGSGGPELVSLMHGPVIHAYGPDWKEELTRDHSYLADRGVTKPYSMTEWGISTDDGPDLGDNYGFPTDLTYDAAGAVLAAALREMAGMPGRLRQVILFQLADQRDPGTDTEREHYFGLLTLDGDDKGALTAVAKEAFARYPGPGL